MGQEAPLDICCTAGLREDINARDTPMGRARS